MLIKEERRLCTEDRVIGDESEGEGRGRRGMWEKKIYGEEELGKIKRRDAARNKDREKARPRDIQVSNEMEIERYSRTKAEKSRVR